MLRGEVAVTSEYPVLACARQRGENAAYEVRSEVSQKVMLLRFRHGTWFCHHTVGSPIESFLLNLSRLIGEISRVAHDMVTYK
jgi:hypothetical protein